MVRSIKPVLMVHALVWLLVLACWPAQGRARSRQRTVRLAVGETIVLPGTSVTRLAVGNSEVLEVRRLDDGQILLFGREEGRSSLTIWRGKRSEMVRVVVAGDQVERFITACASLLGEPCSFLRASNVEGRVVVTGTVNDVESYDKLRKVRRAFRQVEFLVEVNPKVLDVIVPLVNAELHQAGFEQATVRRVGGRLFLEGQVENEQERGQAQKIVEEYVGGAMGAGE
jgi:Flp pilus assembly secretin CpaC